MSTHLIHPDTPHLHRHVSPLSAAREFLDLVRNLEEEDYGDFMRTVNAGLLQLKESFDREPEASKTWIDQVQDYVQFSPNWHVPSTKKRLITDAEALVARIEIRNH